MVIRAALSVGSPWHVKRASESRRFRSDELIQNLRNSRRFLRRKIWPPIFLRSLRPFASSAVKIFGCGYIALRGLPESLVYLKMPLRRVFKISFQMRSWSKAGHICRMIAWASNSRPL